MVLFIGILIMVVQQQRKERKCVRSWRTYLHKVERGREGGREEGREGGREKEREGRRGRE